MKKIIRHIKDLFVPKMKKVVVLAGISFMLFSGSYSADAAVGVYELQPRTEIVAQVEDKTEYVVLDAESEVTVGLRSNVMTLSQKIENAYERFITREGTECEIFRPLVDEISVGLSGIKADSVSMDGYAETGEFNMSFILPDKALLSVNTILNETPEGVVSFNLYKDKELLLADVQTLENLNEYITTVQSILL